MDKIKLAKLTEDRDDGDAILQVGIELAGAEYRIDKALAELRNDLNRVELAVRRGTETDNLHFNPGTAASLAAALGERNALLRVMKRFGLDVSKL